MSTASGRITVLVTPNEKARISRAAKAAGLSMGEYLRRAASSFRLEDDDKVLDGLLDQVKKTTASASHALDLMLTEIMASQARIDAMEQARRSIVESRRA